MGVDVDLPAGATMPLRPGFEYALIVLTGTVIVAGQRLAPGQLGYLGRGRNELALQISGADARAATRRRALGRADPDVVELRCAHPQ